MDNKQSWFRLCVAAAYADEEIDEEELALLHRIAAGLGLSEKDTEEAVQAILGGAEPEIPEVAPAEAEELLRLVARVTGADDVLEPEERTFVESLGQQMGLSAAAINTLIDEAI